jgi:hypothetical protein
MKITYIGDFYMKKPFKISLIVTSILTVLFLGGYIALHFIEKSFGGLDTFIEPIKHISDIIKAIFKSEDILTFVMFSLGSVIIVALLVLLILALIKNKPAIKKIVVAVLCLLAVVPAFYVVLLGYIWNWPDAIKLLIESKELSKLIIVIVYLLCALGAIVCAILSAIFGLLSSRSVEPVAAIAQDAVAPVVEEITTADATPEAEEEIVPEPIPVFVPEPEPEIEETIPVEEVPAPAVEPEPEVAPEPTPEPAPAPAIDTTMLAALLKDVVRDIVRDEIARNNLAQPAPTPATDNHSIVGATFGGPLVVQYFNGGINGVTPAPAPCCAAPAPTPVVEETPAPAVEQVVAAPAPAPVVEEVPAPAPVEEVAVVAAPAPVAEPALVAEPKVPIIRIPFQERLVEADKEMQDNYNELKNEILSWGVKSRVSNSGDTFRLHRKTYIKLTIAGKSLKLYFALNPEDYRDSTIPVQDAGGKNIYEEIPLVFKVKSGLSL